MTAISMEEYEVLQEILGWAESSGNNGEGK